MANGQNELRSVNWNDVFGFTHVFKSFRMAIHLSKLLLALAAILLISITGWLLDRVWSVSDSGYVQHDAVAAHFFLNANQYGDARRAWQDGRAQSAASEWERAFIQQRTLSVYMSSMAASDGGGLFTAFGNLVNEENDKDSDWESPKRADLLTDAEESWTGALAQAKVKFRDEVDRIEELLEKAQDNVEKDIRDLGRDKRDEARQAMEQDLLRARFALTARKKDFHEAIERIRGQGVFSALVAHESRSFTNAALALCRGDIRGGLADYQASLRRRREGPAAPAAATAFPDPGRGGVLYWSLMACHGLCWLLWEHVVYAIIFLLISLAIWSVFGGAIHRIAAIQAAREEKISMRQALRFSVSKFLSFFTAPLIPLVGILILGVILIAGGLLGNLWGLGALLIGVLFGLALLVGLIIAFVVVGLAAGAGLMYPTIAVEGSDSFDAISRSFSYVFNKPWRALAYAVAALAHGSLCYVFLRGFAFIALRSTHFFAKGGIWQGGQTVPGAVDKLDIMWEAPTFASLHAPVPSEALSGMEYVGAVLVAFWIHIIIGLLVAFVLSYASSATTVIYYLLRRKVDATDLDDVYVEEAEEEQLPAPLAEEPAAKAEGETAEEETEPEEEPEEGAGDEADSEK